METLGHTSQWSADYKEVVTKVLTPDLLWEDLRHTILACTELGYSSVGIMLGFAWGNHVEDEGWKYITIQTGSLEHWIKDAEQEWDGEVGYDDFYLTFPIPGIRAHFCHETDILIRFDTLKPIVDIKLCSWLENDWILPSDKQRVENLVS